MDKLSLEPAASALLREVELAVGPLPWHVQADMAREVEATGRPLSEEALAAMLNDALPELGVARARQYALGEGVVAHADKASAFEVAHQSAVDFLADEARRARLEREAAQLPQISLAEVVGATTASKAPAAKKTQTFSILHVNDSHSNLSNLSRLATLIKEARKIDPNILVIHSGDLMVGTPLHELEPKGAAEIEILRALGVKVLVVGNHDLDDGPAVLAKALRRYPELQVVCANWEASGELGKRIRPYVVEKIGNAKVAIVGLSVNPTEYGDTSGTITYRTPEATLKTLLPAIAKKDRPDAIIAATHHGASKDEELAGVFPSVNGWLGGHDHRSFTRPKIVTHPDGSRSILSEAGSSFEMAAFERYEMLDGKIKAVKGTLVEIDDTIAPDPQMEKVVQSYRTKLKAYDKVIATATSTVAGRARTPDTRLGNYVTDMMRTDFAEKYGPIDICIFNKTGLRGAIPKGDVSLWTMYELFPFPNTAALTDLTGAQIQTMLNNAARRGGDPISGVSYTVDSDKAVDVKVGGQPLDPEKTYRVISNSYLIGKGGSGYDVLTRGKNTVDTGVTIRDMLTAHLERVGKVDAPAEVEERTFIKQGSLVERIRKVLELSDKATARAA